MGTVAEILVVHDDVAQAQDAIDMAFARLRWVDATMSRFRHDSDIGRANAGAWKDAVVIRPETALVIGEALGWAEASHGTYDPGLARLVEAWDVTHRTAPPEPEVFARLAGRHFYRGVELVTWRGRPAIRFENPDIGIDLGGIAKGYAVDAAIAELEGNGIHDAVVNVGGDLRAIGRSPDGDWWQVGIRDPQSPSRTSDQLEVRNQAVATSGDYLQGFQNSGRWYHHILDPRTGEPRRAVVHSITVRASTCMTADAGATAVFGLSMGPAREILERSSEKLEVVS